MPFVTCHSASQGRRMNAQLSTDIVRGCLCLTAKGGIGSVKISGLLDNPDKEGMRRGAWLCRSGQ